MNKTVNRFSRIIAILLIITVSYMFCSCPVNPIPENPNTQQGPSPLTPGVGTPRYFYVDSDGSYIENEGDGSGRTGLIVEDNPFAEGVLIYSDDTGTDDRVGFLYEDSIVSMSFKKDSNFPYSMNIKNGSDEYYAYVSKYDAVNHTYHVTFVYGGQYEMMNNVVLNENIFSLYKDDLGLSVSQNRRMANMVIAMGVWGSLYATFDRQLSDTPYLAISRGINWGNVSRKIAEVFYYVAVVSAIIAVVVAPIVMFVDPAAGVALFGAASMVSLLSLDTSKKAEEIANNFDKQEKEKDQMKVNFIPIVYVSRVEPDGKEYPVKYNDNEVHEEFHIPVGEELIIKFYIPGFNNEKLPEIWDKIVSFDEPQIPRKNGIPDEVINLSLFSPQYPVLTNSDEEGVFFVKFKRINPYNKTSDFPKINFGIILNFEDEETKKPIDLTVNGYKGGFNFRLYGQDDVPVLYKNIVVIYFCTKENCPDIR
jgi:hypothetical protein